MSGAKCYEFESGMRTMSEICALVPALHVATIRKHLRAGRTTRQAMLTFDSAARMRLGGIRGRANSERGKSQSAFRANGKGSAQ